MEFLEYPFIAIIPRFTLSQNSRIYYDLIYGGTRLKKLFLLDKKRI